MSYIQFWKETVISQVISGSISFVASSLIVTFICLHGSGLSTPYRRIIFGLSISDMCQSFAILAGPFLIESDIPQAIWGIGNKHTCHFDGFLYLVGVTAVPMYTVFLCAYYVCKLKNRMTDDEFTKRIEKKVHIAIVGVNLGLPLTALGMDVINPSAIGNSCTPASVPAGCSQRPDIYVECAPNIQSAVKFFVILTVALVPVLSLAGIIACMGLIFWHVLLRERVYGPTSANANTNTSNSNTGNNSNAEVLVSPPGYHHRRRRRARYLRTSEFATSSVDDLASIQGGLIAVDDEECRIISNLSTSPEETLLNEDIDIDIKNSNTNTNTSTSVQTVAPKSNDANTTEPANTFPNPTPDTVSSLRQEEMSNISENWSNRGGMSVNIFPSSDNLQSLSFRLSRPVSRSGALDVTTNRNPVDVVGDAETLSRLYKKELLKQVCCYVFVFSVSTMPFLILNLLMISGVQPPKIFMRFNAVLYPLTGLFNIIVYTRWNVASWRRKHPECSRLRAFYLVLKAGGDLPSENAV